VAFNPGRNNYEQALERMRQHNWAEALELLTLPSVLTPANARHLVLRAHCWWSLAERHAALEAALAAWHLSPSDPAILDSVATIFSLANDQLIALDASDRAVQLAPANTRYRYNRAAIRRFAGDLEGAEADYDSVIADRPVDYEAYLNRTELRIQSAVRNHISELEALIAHPIGEWRAEVQVRYALAKEYEDTGDYQKSFAHLRAGADLQRSHMGYNVAQDVDTVDWIIDAFSKPESAPIEPGRGPEDSPIFIVGLPRSGSTLIERILSSHSQIAAAGELNCLAHALVDAAAREGGNGNLPRRTLVRASATVDFSALGRDYLRRARSALGVQGRFIDKMPLNYLYCGIIHRALPNARIIHVTRHPMAVGYAMYKTLFKDGYPFSYDLKDIARYYAAYRRLMTHWRDSLGDELLEVSYEDLIEDQAGETRRLLEACGLDWQENCMTFHRNAAATMTASASQVRRPLYASSVNQWRHYAEELEPLRRAFREVGIST
jgi:tetratricopeptide (TPR) repeat protein